MKEVALTITLSDVKRAIHHYATPRRLIADVDPEIILPVIEKKLAALHDFSESEYLLCVKCQLLLKPKVVQCPGCGEWSRRVETVDEGEGIWPGDNEPLFSTYIKLGSEAVKNVYMRPPPREAVDNTRRLRNELEAARRQAENAIKHNSPIKDAHRLLSDVAVALKTGNVVIRSECYEMSCQDDHVIAVVRSLYTVDIKDKYYEETINAFMKALREW